jgi:hypothetical protein
MRAGSSPTPLHELGACRMRNTEIIEAAAKMIPSTVPTSRATQPPLRRRVPVLSE